MAGIQPIVLISIGVLILWNTGVTFFLFKSIRHYNTLIKSADRQTLQGILSSLLSNTKENTKTIQTLQESLEALQHRNDLTIQKVSLVRFNPFVDTGGEQSFIIGLLDTKNNGILITSLQGRSGVRWYAKEIKTGKGTEFDLSKEEKQAVQSAKYLNEL